MSHRNPRRDIQAKRRRQRREYRWSITRPFAFGMNENRIRLGCIKSSPVFPYVREDQSIYENGVLRCMVSERTDALLDLLLPARPRPLNNREWMFQGIDLGSLASHGLVPGDAQQRHVARLHRHDRQHIQRAERRRRMDVTP